MTECFEVTLEEDISEKIGLLVQADTKAFDKLSVFFDVFTFDNRYQIILILKCVFIIKEITVITFFGAYEITSMGVKLKLSDCVKNAEAEYQNLWVNKPIGMLVDPICQASEPSFHPYMLHKVNIARVSVANQE